MVVGGELPGSMVVGVDWLPTSGSIPHTSSRSRSTNSGTTTAKAGIPSIGGMAVTGGTSSTDGTVVPTRLECGAHWASVPSFSEGNRLREADRIPWWLPCALLVASPAVREDLPHIRVRICGTLKIIEVLAGG